MIICLDLFVINCDNCLQTYFEIIFLWASRFDTLKEKTSEEVCIIYQVCRASSWDIFLRHLLFDYQKLKTVLR